MVEIVAVTPFADIMQKLRRSARNGERLHLDAEHVVAIIGSSIWPEMAKLEAEEIAAEWQTKTSLDNSGLLGEPTEASGQFAGTTDPTPPAVESLLASEITMGVIRQSKLNKRSRLILPPTASQKKSTPDQQTASAAS